MVLFVHSVCRTQMYLSPQVRLHSNDGSFDSNNKQSDFGRLARILTGTAVGVVLGGGGARGLCHFGVIQVHSLYVV